MDDHPSWCGATNAPTAGPARPKIWDFTTKLHCSIIVTCLSTGDVRQILKLGVASPDSLTTNCTVPPSARWPSTGGQAAEQGSTSATGCDRPPAKAHSEDEVRVRGAMRRGDIPAPIGPPSPTATQTINARHSARCMLSHLVGANRADIRPLHQRKLTMRSCRPAGSSATQTRGGGIAGRNHSHPAGRRPIVARAPNDDSGALVPDLERRLAGNAPQSVRRKADQGTGCSRGSDRQG